MGGKALNGKRVSILKAIHLISRFVTKLEKLGAIKKASIAGSLRRKLCMPGETVGDLDLVVIPTNKFKWVLCSKYGASETAEVKFSVKVEGCQIDILTTTPKSWGAALMTATGPWELNVIQRSYAKKHGYKLNEYGLFKDDEYVAGKTEKDIYAVFGKDEPMPVEEREKFKGTLK